MIKISTRLFTLFFLFCSGALIAQPSISVTPLSLDYGAIAVGSDSLRSISISNVGNSDLLITNFGIQGTDANQFALVNPLLPPITLPPGAPPVILDIRFAPTRPGVLQADLQILSDDPLNDTLLVPLQGTGIGPDIALIPDSLGFGEVDVNSDSLSSFAIANPGNDTLVISAVRPFDGDTSQFRLENLPAFPVSLPPGAAPVAILVRFQPGSFGFKSAQIEVISNDFDQNPALATVTGTGMAADIFVNPPQLNFGNVLVQGDAVLDLEIANLGNDTLLITSAGIVGPNNNLFSFASTLQLPLRIAPGAPPETASLRFSPDSVGAKSAFLVLTSNDPNGNENPLVVQMSGVGVVSDIAVSDTTLDFGDVVVGEDSVAAVMISNLGAGTLIITDLNIVGDDASDFEVFNPPPLPIEIRPGGAPVEARVRFVPGSRGAKQALFAITSNDPDPNENPLFVSLSGMAFESDITAEPASLQFDTVRVGQSRVLSTYLKNLGDANLVIDSLNLAGPNNSHFELVDSYQFPIIIPVGSDSLEVSLRFAPNSIGIKNAALEVFSNDPDENPLSIALTGLGVEPDILVFPATLSFGGVRVGNQEERFLQIFNTGGAPLTISDTLFSGDDARLFSLASQINLPVVMPPSSGPLLWPIRFRPDSVGTKTARFTLVSDDPDGTASEASLSGEGIQPGIDIVPTELNFDSVRVLTTDFRSLQIFNSGTDVLLITGLELSGADSGMFGFSNLPGLPIEIAPGANPLIITLRFSPLSLGEKTAMLHVHSDDPNSPETLVPLRGRGVEPNLAVSSDTVNFGPSVVGVTSTATLQLINLGDDDLTVLAMLAGGNGFRLIDAPVPPFAVGPGDTLDIMLGFRPDSLGAFRGLMQILSDDPDHPLTNIVLLGEGVLPEIVVDADTLDFGFVKLNSGMSRLIGITNTGGAPLQVQALMLSGPGAGRFRIGDVPEPPFVVTDSTDTVFVEVIFRPEAKGLAGATLEIFSNDSLRSPLPVLLEGTGVKGPSVEELTFTPIQLNSGFIIDTRVTADTSIHEVVLYLGANNVSGFPLRLPLVPEEPGQYRGQIGDSLVTTAGLKMFLEVVDDYPTVTRDTLFPVVTVPAGALTYRIPAITLNRWQMFSLPFASGGGASIDQILENLGPEGDFTWRIFRTDASGQSDNYFTRNELNAMGEYGRFAPGNAFWLYVRQDEGGQVPTTLLDFPELQTLPGDSFQVRLLPGWNQVGNPYAFPIRWSQVSSADLDTLNIYSWDGQLWNGLNQKVGWSPKVNQDFALQPWDGYAVFNPLPDTVALVFHPEPADTVAIPPQQKMAAGWQVNLVAANHSAFDLNVLGMHPLAREGIDRFDYRNPSSLQEPGVSLAFRQRDVNGRDIDLASDFRPVNSQGALWYVSVQSSKPQLTVFAQGLDGLPAGFQMLLYDTKYRKQYGMKEGMEVLLRDVETDEPDRLAVIVGTDGFISDALPQLKLMAPVAYELLANYPNPFNPETNIRFRLKEAGHVSLAIFNVLGQKVRQITDKFYPAGFYEVKWDGRSDAGQETASGLYIYRLEANGFSKARKMLKLK